MAEVGATLVNELNLSSDEVDRLTQALKDEKFNKMLHDYAQEISDPANRAKYEEEVKLFEQERGNSVEFIHPAPCRAIETRAGGGEQTCFINICGHEKIGKPGFKCAVTKDGRSGQFWSLHYSLFPGRQNIDPKGNKYLIYDVIFHPDTLQMAAKDKLFNDMVNNTAIDGIQKTFNVILDKNNVREIKTKYKGTPQPCVIRKPIPGCEAKETPGQPDPLSFPSPNVAKPSKIQPQTAKEPAEPNYTVKYRSVVDLQDYRCSRDSAPSPRPKEMVIVIDLPLLKSVGDTSLEVKSKILQLESKQPAYRLRLPLAYPVDEEKGEAKFNKQRRQLTVTLPVQPPEEASLCPDPGQREEERREEEEEERGSGMQGKAKGTEELGMETTTENVVKEELAEAQEKKGKEPERKDKESEGQGRRDELSKHETCEETAQEWREELTVQTKRSRDHEKTVEDRCDGSAAQRDCCFPDNNPVPKTTFPAEEETTDKDKEAKEASTHESTSKETTEIIQTEIQDDVSEGGPESSQIADITNASNRGVSRGVLQTPELDEMPPPAALREVDADGNETVIGDHSTSAGFIFQNKLMYELD